MELFIEVNKYTVTCFRVIDWHTDLGNRQLHSEDCKNSWCYLVYLKRQWHTGIGL